MSRYILFVLSQHSEGNEAEYNRWYDEQHLAEICAIPGVVGAQRYKALPAGATLPPVPYAAIYQLDVENPATVMSAIKTGSRDGTIFVSDALDKQTTTLWLFKELNSYDG